MKQKLFLEEILLNMQAQLSTIERKVTQMALDQATFDAELADLVAAITALIAAVDAIPPTDLTAEGQTVADAAAAVKAELDKLTPPAA